MLTAWFAMGVSQALLVGVGRTDLHRRMGWAAAGLAILVVMSWTMALIGSVRRSIADGGEIESLKRVHAATTIGLALSFLSIAIPLSIAQTEIGQAIVRSLG
jgi:hypothetical protein